MEKYTNMCDPDLRKLVEKVTLPKKEFTRILKDFYKKFGSNGKYSVQISPQDSVRLFYSLQKYILDLGNTGESRYNAYRIIGLSFHIREIFMDFFYDAMDLIEKTYLDENGNVRQQAYYVFEDILFLGTYGVTEPLYGKKMTKKLQKNADIVYPRVIDFYKTVIAREQEREDEIFPGTDFERKDQRGFMPYSGDTSDKILKNCRRITERLDFPHMFQKFQEYGYTMEWSSVSESEKEDISKIDVQEYEEDLVAFIKFHELKLSLKKIKELVYNDDGSMPAFHEFLEYFLESFDNKGIEPSQEDLNFIAIAWTVFPHKCLGGKSPQDML